MCLFVVRFVFSHMDVQLEVSIYNFLKSDSCNWIPMPFAYTCKLCALKWLPYCFLQFFKLMSSPPTDFVIQEKFLKDCSILKFAVDMINI